MEKIRKEFKIKDGFDFQKIMKRFGFEPRYNEITGEVYKYVYNGSISEELITVYVSSRDFSFKGCMNKLNDIDVEEIILVFFELDRGGVLEYR